MSRPTCPYLGLESDPTTALGFPSEGNFCHNARPIAPINIEHQEHYCLTRAHHGCPVYRRDVAAPLPAALTAPSYKSARNRRIAGLLLLTLLVIGTTALLLASPLQQILANVRFNLIPRTGEQTSFDGADQFSFFLLTPSYTPLMPLSTTGVEVAQKENCPMPQGWMPYIVNPTDSLFRLSVVYSVPVGQLQQVNCMGDSTTILPGEVLYVPFTPSRTPTATRTFTAPVAMVLPLEPTASPSSTPRPRNPAAGPILATNTPSASPTISASPVVIVTSSPTLVTATPTPSPTATLIPTALPSATVLPTQTPVPTNTPNPTSTLAPTNTPVPTNTAEPTNTLPPTNTLEPTETLAPTFTTVPTNTLEPTTEIEPSDTPEPDPTEIPPATQSPAETEEPEPTLSPIETPAPPPDPEPPQPTDAEMVLVEKTGGRR